MPAPSTRNIIPLLPAAGVRNVTLTLAGTSSLASTVTAYQRFSATVAGTSSLSATVIAAQRFTATIAGTSSLTGSLTLYQRVAVTFAGTSSLSGTITRYQILPVTFAGTSSLAGTITDYQIIGVTFVGTSSLAIVLSGGSTPIAPPVGSAGPPTPLHVSRQPRRPQPTRGPQVRLNPSTAVVYVNAQPATLTIRLVAQPARGRPLVSRASSPRFSVALAWSTAGVAVATTPHADTNTINAAAELQDRVEQTLMALEA
jgi:hypothetical protein